MFEPRFQVDSYKIYKAQLVLQCQGCYVAPKEPILGRD